MSRRSKIIAQMDRQRRARERLVEEQEALENWQRLKTMVAGFSTRKGKIKKILSPVPNSTRYEERQPLLQRSGAHRLRTRQGPELSPEMLAREQAALQKTEELKARIGQVGNKMGLQYLTDSDLEDSRKGLLRRRS